MAKDRLLFIYKTTNLVTGLIYVGLHYASKLDDGYIGCGVYCQKDVEDCLSSFYFQNAVKKYGYENFKREILEFCETKEELNEREKFWIRELNSNNIEIGYNLTKGGEGGDIWSGRKHSEESKEKMRVAARTRLKRTEEHCRHLSEAKMGISHSLESNQKRSKTMMGKISRPCPEEQKLRISRTLKLRNENLRKEASHR